MNGREFVRRARRYARKTRQTFSFDPTHGKGSHGQVKVGDYSTTVKHGEIPPGLLADMLKQLGINRREF